MKTFVHQLFVLQLDKFYCFYITFCNVTTEIEFVYNFPYMYLCMCILDINKMYTQFSTLSTNIWCMSNYTFVIYVK